MFDASVTSLFQKSSTGQSKARMSWDDAYRERWKWDRVVWGSHSVDCYPGNCPFRVYVRDGKVSHEAVICPDVRTLLRWAAIDHDRTFLVGAELPVLVAP